MSGRDEVVPPGTRLPIRYTWRVVVAGGGEAGSGWSPRLDVANTDAELALRALPPGAVARAELCVQVRRGERWHGGPIRRGLRAADGGVRWVLPSDEP